MPRGICRYAMVINGSVHAMCALPDGHQEEVRNTPSLEALRWNGHRLMTTRGQYLNAPFACGHCGRPMGDMAGGFAIVQNVRVCHPNTDGRPDCYKLISVYHEVIGVRRNETELRFV